MPPVLSVLPLAAWLNLKCCAPLQQNLTDVSLQVSWMFADPLLFYQNISCRLFLAHIFESF